MTDPDPTTFKRQDLALVVSITLVSLFALAVALMSLVDRQISKGTTFKEVDLAAWVQAVGSVLAILATGAGVWWTHQLERIRALTVQAESAAMVVEYVCTTMDEGVEIVGAFHKGLSHEPALDDAQISRAMPLIANSIRAWIVAFGEVPVASLPTAKTLRPILQFRAAMSECLRLLEQPAREGPRDGNLQLEIERHMQRLTDSRQAFKNATGGKRAVGAVPAGRD